uniref:Uncharacterized protein n=1 Tax=Caenorhabditis tropicalis TaxID=1561998 RepID=A0A1I7UMG2_9PELO
MEQSPTFKSNLNSEMSDLVHQAEEWAQVPQVSPQSNPHLEKIFTQVLFKASLLVLEKSGVKTVDEFKQMFGSEREAAGKGNEEEEVIEVQREGALSSSSFEELQVQRDRFSFNSFSVSQSYLKKDWSELLEEPLSSHSPFDCRRRRTSLFSDINVLSPIVSEASHSPEKIKRVPSLVTPLRSCRKPLFTSTSTPKIPWKRGNSMYIEDGISNETMRVTPRPSLSASTLSRQSPAPLPGETPLENRASRLRRMNMEERLRESQISF